MHTTNRDNSAWWFQLGTTSGAQVNATTTNLPTFVFTAPTVSTTLSVHIDRRGLRRFSFDNESKCLTSQAIARESFKSDIKL